MTGTILARCRRCTRRPALEASDHGHSPGRETMRRPAGPSAPFGHQFGKVLVCAGPGSGSTPEPSIQRDLEWPQGMASTAAPAVPACLQMPATCEAPAQVTSPQPMAFPAGGARGASSVRVPAAGPAVAGSEVIRASGSEAATRDPYLQQAAMVTRLIHESRER